MKIVTNSGVTLFKYIEPLWLGSNCKVSIKRVLALAFSWNFIDNLSFAVRKFEVGKSLSDVALLLGIEAGLIAGLLTLTTYSSTNMFNKTVGNDQQETINPE